MADANYVKFHNRLNKINRNQRKLSRGYVHLVERDGLLVPVTKRRTTRRAFPFGGLMLTLAGFLGFKGVLLAYLGPITYDERVGKLADGNVGEQVGAWIMGADPATTWIAAQLTGLF